MRVAEGVTVGERVAGGVEEQLGVLEDVPDSVPLGDRVPLKDGVPLGDGEQLGSKVEPALHALEHVHWVQNEAPESEYFPEGHVVQLDRPLLPLKVPAGQL